MKIAILKEENKIHKAVLDFSDIVGYRLPDNKIHILKNRIYGITGPVKTTLFKSWVDEALKHVMEE